MMPSRRGMTRSVTRVLDQICTDLMFKVSSCVSDLLMDLRIAYICTVRENDEIMDTEIDTCYAFIHIRHEKRQIFCPLLFPDVTGI